MDAIDLEIVETLASDGRITFSELATRIGLSGPSASERVRRLESEGVIAGYAAILDPDSVDAGLAAFISVTLVGPHARQLFLEAVYEDPSVLELHHTAGDGDYLLKVRCANTRELERLVSERLKGVDGVASTRTTVVLSSAFERVLGSRTHA